MSTYRALADRFRVGGYLTDGELRRLHELASDHGNYLLADATQKAVAA